MQLDLNSTCAHALGYASTELEPTITFLEAHIFVAPVIRSRATKTFRVGTPSTFTVKSKADPTASLSESGELPSGVTFVDQGNGDAVLSGTPGAGTLGSFPISITATNGGSPDVVQAFTLTVNPPRR